MKVSPPSGELQGMSEGVMGRGAAGKRKWQNQDETHVNVVGVDVVRVGVSEEGVELDSVAVVCSEEGGSRVVTNQSEFLLFFLPNRAGGISEK